jgi:putative membrane protein
MISLKQKISTIFVIFMVSTWFYSVHPLEQFFHTSLTIVALFVLWKLDTKNSIKNFDFILIMIFLTVHTIGARWLYSFVPYNDWIYMLSGINLNELFGWNRNHYDRLIHFLYGVLLTPAFTSMIMRYQVNKLTAFWLSVGIIMVSGVFYEWIEWFVSIVLSAQDAESYNGQQGDVWDPHKDMLLGAIGSLLWYFKYKKI